MRRARFVVPGRGVGAPHVDYVHGSVFEKVLAGMQPDQQMVFPASRSSPQHRSYLITTHPSLSLDPGADGLEWEDEMIYRGLYSPTRYAAKLTDTIYSHDDPAIKYLILGTADEVARLCEFGPWDHPTSDRRKGLWGADLLTPRLTTDGQPREWEPLPTVKEWDIKTGEVFVIGSGPLPPTCSNVYCNSPRWKMCGRCRALGYCSRECQEKHWPTHKAVCRLWGAL